MNKNDVSSAAVPQGVVLRLAGAHKRYGAGGAGRQFRLPLFPAPAARCPARAHR